MSDYVTTAIDIEDTQDAVSRLELLAAAYHDLDPHDASESHVCPACNVLSPKINEQDYIWTNVSHLNHGDTVRFGNRNYMVCMIHKKKDNMFHFYLVDKDQFPVTNLEKTGATQMQVYRLDMCSTCRHGIQIHGVHGLSRCGLTMCSCKEYTGVM